MIHLVLTQMAFSATTVPQNTTTLNKEKHKCLTATSHFIIFTVSHLLLPLLSSIVNT